MTEGKWNKPNDDIAASNKRLSVQQEEHHFMHYAAAGSDRSLCSLVFICVPVWLVVYGSFSHGARQKKQCNFLTAISFFYVPFIHTQSPTNFALISLQPFHFLSLWMTNKQRLWWVQDLCSIFRWQKESHESRVRYSCCCFYIIIVLSILLGENDIKSSSLSTKSVFITAMGMVNSTHNIILHRRLLFKHKATALSIRPVPPTEQETNILLRHFSFDGTVYHILPLVSINCCQIESITDSD